MNAKGWRGWRAALLGVELLVGANAVYGGISLITDAWHLPPDYLSPLPWDSWVPPGIALLLLVAAPMFGAAALVPGDHRRAADASVAAGVLLAGWIVAQLAIVGPRFWLQPLMFGVGLAVAAMALRWRARGRVPT